MTDPATIKAQAERLGAYANSLHVDKNYNVTPTTLVPVVYQFSGQPTAAMIPWGVRDTYDKAPLVLNARSEKLTTSRFWKPMVATHRCLMLASGFYEWETTARGKQPHYFTLPARPAFTFAALWQEGEQPGCTIVTTAANSLMARYHDRIPVILDEEDARAWLGSEPLPANRLAELCQPYPSERMREHPVTRRMSSVYYKEADSILPDATDASTGQTELF